MRGLCRGQSQAVAIQEEGLGLLVFVYTGQSLVNALGSLTCVHVSSHIPGLTPFLTRSPTASSAPREVNELWRRGGGMGFLRAEGVLSAALQSQCFLYSVHSLTPTVVMATAFLLLDRACSSSPCLWRHWASFSVCLSHATLDSSGS